MTEARQVLSFRARVEAIAEVDEQAAKLGIDRGDLLRRIMTLGLQAHLAGWPGDRPTVSKPGIHPFVGQRGSERCAECGRPRAIGRHDA